MNKTDSLTYIALLRGINLGKHHKVPMAVLRKEMEEIGFSNVQTLLNSGNVIFDGAPESEKKLEDRITSQLENRFDFHIPVLVRTAEEILELHNTNPFEEVTETENIRLYITFLKEDPQHELSLPWTSGDGAFRIVEIQKRAICSVVDLSQGKSTEAMQILEQLFGKNITTRNWNTIRRIAKKIP